MATSITPTPLHPQADFKTNPTPTPSPSTQYKPTYPRTTPPARPETPPTPELTFASILNLNSPKLWEAKAPPPLDLPLYLSSTPTHSQSNHSSPVVCPYAASSISSGSFESISLESLSSEALGLEDDDEDEAIRPPAPAFLRDHSGVCIQGRMMCRPRPTKTTYVPYPRGVRLPFTIIEEEEPPEEGEEVPDHASPSGQEREREKADTESTSTTESSFDDRKERKRGSLGKCIKWVFVGRADAVRLGLKV